MSKKKQSKNEPVNAKAPERSERVVSGGEAGTPEVVSKNQHCKSELLIEAINQIPGISAICKAQIKEVVLKHS